MVKGLKADYHVQRYALKHQKHPLDAGLDLYGTRADFEIKELNSSWVYAKIPTGFHVVLAHGCAGMITCRSSSEEMLQGAEVMTGIIDPHYSGEIFLRIKFLKADVKVTYEAITKAITEEVALAQMLVLSCYLCAFAQWDETFAKSLTRGQNGFGSTNGLITPP